MRFSNTTVLTGLTFSCPKLFSDRTQCFTCSPLGTVQALRPSLAELPALHGSMNGEGCAHRFLSEKGLTLSDWRRGKKYHSPLLIGEIHRILLVVVFNLFVQFAGFCG